MSRHVCPSRKPFFNIYLPIVMDDIAIYLTVLGSTLYYILGILMCVHSNI